MDTLKILQRFGLQYQFYGNGDENDLKELQALLESGESVSALFCEVPTNPLLKTSSLEKLKQLADHYGFVIVIDDTLGNPCNLDLAPYADIFVSSLTKIFSGVGDALAGR